MKKYNKKLGFIGENIAEQFLVKHRHITIHRNFRTKYGEIDLITIDGNKILHFIEVKTVSRETFNSSVIRETYYHSPEENITILKLSKITKTAEFYINSKKPNCLGFQIDAICITINSKKKDCRLRFMQNINC